jgi:hypothetical protein
MPEIEEPIPTYKTIEIWNGRDRQKDDGSSVYLRLKRSDGSRPRVVLCNIDGETLPSGNLFGFGSSGELEVYSSVTSLAEELGMAMDKMGRLIVNKR